MKIKVALCSLTLLIANSAGAGDLFDVNVSLDGAYRTDELNWDIGASDIKKLSALSYDDIRIYEIGSLISAKVNSGIFAGVYAEFDISWGTIDKGDATDKDWENPADPSQVTNYSSSDVKGDDVQDYSLALGYEFQLGDSGFLLTPMIGYSYHEQNLDIGGGATTLASVYDDAGNYSHSEQVNDPLPSEAATYDTEWKGAWAGLDIRYTASDRDIFSVEVQYHDYDYDAVGDWILIDTQKHPKSFTHSADGDGYSVSVNYARILTLNWDFIAGLNYKDFETDSGTEKNFLTDGTVLKQNFNGATWESYSASVGVTYKF